jgi:hypothetical protein
MAAKVGENSAVDVVLEEWACELADQYHAVGHGRARAALAQASAAKHVDQKVVYDAEHGSDKIVRAHGRQGAVGN